MTLREQLEPHRGEEYFYGTDKFIGFLFLDMRGMRIAPGGAQVRSLKLILKY